jgi:glycosyltransferase involved in cell wall biosynthesis
MTRVLLLAYHFPPIGGAGVQRNTKLCRYLPELGYELDVVTGPGLSAHDRWAPLDESMQHEIPDEVRVHRVAGPEPGWREGTGDRARRWLRRPGAWQLWWEKQAVPLAVAVGQGADLGYASLAPYSTARAAIEIAHRLGRPLVFDLEDPWALDEMLVYETGLHRRLEERTMRRALARADGIVMNTPESERRLRQTFPELEQTTVTSILNGYDRADFTRNGAGRSPGVLRVVHTGSLHTDLGRRRSALRRLRGGSMEVNVLSRSLVFLRRALDELYRSDPELIGRIELHLAGRLTDGDRKTLDGLTGMCEHGFLPHAATIELMRSADLLFLPMHDVPAGRRVAIVPCKTYEYLASGRPILAAVPDGDARDLCSEAGNATICRPTDVPALAAGIREALRRLEAGTEPPPPNPRLLARVERRALTRELAAFLETSVLGSAPSPARVAVPA